MAKSLATPAKYFQGSTLLSDAYRYVSHLGRSFVIVSDIQVKELIEERVKEGFRSAGNLCAFLNFNGESSPQEVSRLAELVRKEEYSGIIGAGGGKALDTAKLVGDSCGLPVVTVPTSASNDSPCSCVASLYTEDGRFIKLQRLKESPAVVLVDTEIIAKAPARLLTAGMGSAYAAYYEARACQRSGIQNYTGGTRAHTALTLTELCHDLLLKYGKQAKLDVQAKTVTHAVEAIVEANIYLSGVGFVNSGCAASHGVYNAMTIALPSLNSMHGEGIAFGVLVQLIMEYNEEGQWNCEEWERTLSFYREVGLPRNFQHLGIVTDGDDQLERIAAAACLPESNIYNMPFEITEKKVFQALKQLRNMKLA